MINDLWMGVDKRIFKHNGVIHDVTLLIKKCLNQCRYNPLENITCVSNLCIPIEIQHKNSSLNKCAYVGVVSVCCLFSLGAFLLDLS